MKLPDFLIIGSMKSGTTTLYDDLARHPNVFLPEEKEPNALVSDDIFEEAALSRYAKLFAQCPDDCITGEASTSYTKLPDYTGVAERVKRVLGASIKLIYIVRDPLRRARSHHAFLYTLGYMPRDANTILTTDRSFIDYSNYGMQLQPWIEVFTRSQIHVVQFENYIQNRNSCYADVCRFLGVDQTASSTLNHAASNQTDQLRPMPDVLRRIRDSRLYLRLHRMLPGKKRSKMGWLRRAVPTVQRPKPISFNDQSLQEIRAELAESTRQFLCAWNLDETLWEI